MAREIECIKKVFYLTPEAFRERWPGHAERIKTQEWVKVVEVFTPSKPGETANAMHLEPKTPLVQRGYQWPDGEWIR